MSKLKLVVGNCFLTGVFILNSGCAVLPEQPIQPIQTIYIVKKGDTLGKISQEMTGSQDNSKAIADYNGIKNQNRIEIGQRLVIPANLSIISVDRSVEQTVSTTDSAPTESSPEEAQAATAIVGAIVGGVISGVINNMIEKGQSTHQKNSGRQKNHNLGRFADGVPEYLQKSASPGKLNNQNRDEERGGSAGPSGAKNRDGERGGSAGPSGAKNRDGKRNRKPDR
ncbi:MAG TPA: LysM peptidoglycan-binding domain-containing protein [Candidatus Competibacteraceae bacterium]|nr:LysM peptidoglycan-binding domain-containing protein [Candidatus Competibacteraceae bacterium]